MMAKFNNMIDLRQTIRLHIIQMDTPLFEQYIEVDKVLATQSDIARHFSEKKTSIVQHVNYIRPYENQKQKYFEDIFQKL